MYNVSPRTCLLQHMNGGKISDGIAATRSLARKKVNVTFKGKNAHAGLNPWDGTNALDAVVAAYVNISLLRQQMPQQHGFTASFEMGAWSRTSFRMKVAWSILSGMQVLPA